MSIEQAPESGQSIAESGSVNNEAELEVNRTAEEYARRVVELSAENKKRKLREQELSKRLGELEGKLSTIDEEKTKEQGKYKESWEKTRSDLDAERKARKQDRASYAFKVITGQLAQAATKSGCVDTDAMIKLASSYGFLDELEPDDEFNLSEENIKSVIEKSQSKMSFLFGKPAPKVVDGAPKTVNSSGKKGLEQLSLQEKIMALAGMDTDRMTKTIESGDRRAFKNN